VDGKCALVKVGLTHGEDCAASEPMTCGLDGACDGHGACRKFGSDTSCHGESCQPGTNQHSQMSHCDGAGAGVPQNMSCGDYQCAADGVKCRVSCVVDADCSSTTFCSGTRCVPRLTPGQLCSRPEQCTSNLCGGKCCNPGAPCKCSQPSKENLIVNPGF